MSSDRRPVFRCAIVVGAAGAFGGALLEKLISLGHSGVGFDKAGGENILTEDALSLSPDACKRIASADLVVLALPDELTVHVGPQIAAQLPAASLMVDCTSTKSRYALAIKLSGPCAKLSINPLFGSGLDWKGRPIAISVLSPGPTVEIWLDFLERVGVEILYMDADTHDRLAAEAQAMVHAMVFAFICSVSGESSRFATPPNRILRLLSARLLSGKPHLYWGIQRANPFAQVARHRLMQAFETLDRIIEKNDADTFEEMWDNARHNLIGDISALEQRCLRVFAHLQELEKPVE